MHLRSYLCLLIVALLFFTCKKETKEPVVDEPVVVTPQKKLMRERQTSYNAKGEALEVNEAFYSYNSASQLSSMSEVWLHYQINMNDTTRHSLIYENGKVVRMNSHMEGDSWTTHFIYDNKNRLIFRIEVENGDSDSTIYSYKGDLITVTNKTFSDIIEHFHTVDRDSSHYTWDPSEPPVVERFFYNSTIDKAYESLRKHLPLFFPRMEMIRKTDDSGETLITREYDGEGFPIKRIENRPKLKVVTDYFY